MFQKDEESKSNAISWLLLFRIKYFKIQSPSVAYVQSCASLSLFGTFGLAISKPDDVEKSYIPQKKALHSSK